MCVVINKEHRKLLKTKMCQNQNIINLNFYFYVVLSDFVYFQIQLIATIHLYKKLRYKLHVERNT